MEYNRKSKNSIFNHALLLLGKSLRELHPDIESESGKGGLGIAVEENHFDYKRNTDPHPDFKEAGVELKTTSLKKNADGSMVSKDKLVLNIFDYVYEAKKEFYTSSFWEKNNFLLLMFYLYEKEKLPIDRVFYIVRNWDFSKISKTDLKIIQDDWNVIHNKICEGKADEISEGDTLYLAACTKGSKANAEMRKQYNSKKLAPQRAYAIKSRYVNTIILDSLKHPNVHTKLFLSDKKIKSILKMQQEMGRAVRSISSYKKDETFEQLIERKFSKYYGKSILEIERKLHVKFGRSKSMAYNVCRAILGVNTKKIAELENAEIAIKTIRLQPNGTLKESMSFPNIRYKEVLMEKEWEDSALYKLFSQRFLFIIFRKMKGLGDKSVRLEKIKFWTMPKADYEYVERLWDDTKEKISQGKYNCFMKASENAVCHIRPKARNAADTTEGAQGFRVKKMSYWLNREYVLKQITNEKS